MDNERIEHKIDIISTKQDETISILKKNNNKYDTLEHCLKDIVLNLTKNTITSEKNSKIIMLHNYIIWSVIVYLIVSTYYFLKIFVNIW